MLNAKKNLSFLNCIASAMLVYFFTIPFHEFIHFLTFYICGDKVRYFSAGSVGSYKLIDYHQLPTFHRIMVTGGSASIINAIIGILIFVLLIKIKDMTPMLRLFLTQLMGGQLLEGFGYFLIGGLFGVGDWGNVFSYFKEAPGFVLFLRIILAIIGAVSSVVILYIATLKTYDFVKDPADTTERRNASAGLNLTLFCVNFIIGSLASLRLPEVRNGDLPLWMFISFNIMWSIYLVAFFYAWGGIMVKPPKESRQKCALPTKPHPILWALAIVLIAIDIIVFDPGIYFG